MYRLGIDLGGTNIAAAVVDENYKIVGRGKVKTDLPRPAEEICDAMAEAAKAAIADAGLKIEDIVAMGVGTPGAVDPSKGIVTFANNLGFMNTPICPMMKERLGVDFYLENDANAAAYGEFLAGAGKGTKNFVAVTLGTGVGGGIVIDGKLFSGSHYAGGELGHTVIHVDGEQCSCG
ncbi:MAG: ROK family protein, partial [Clostridia bacterium]|nr:ROK family protein [Clostridia bacterium]